MPLTQERIAFGWMAEDWTDLNLFSVPPPGEFNYPTNVQSTIFP